MTDRPAPGYTPARGEAKFADLTLHKLRLLTAEYFDGNRFNTGSEDAG